MTLEGYLKVRSEESKESLVETNLSDLGLTLDDLEGKKVLDVGAGPALVGEAARERGVDITSLDADPAQWTQGPTSVDIPEVPYVQGQAERMPFPDETFDLIIDRAGPLNADAINTEGYVQRVFTEAMRVLKTGGELRFGPTPGRSEEVAMLRQIDANVEAHDSGKPGKRFTRFYIMHKTAGD